MNKNIRLIYLLNIMLSALVYLMIWPTTRRIVLLHQTEKDIWLFPIGILFSSAFFWFFSLVWVPIMNRRLIKSNNIFIAGIAKNIFSFSGLLMLFVSHLGMLVFLYNQMK